VLLERGDIQKAPFDRSHGVVIQELLSYDCWYLWFWLLISNAKNATKERCKTMRAYGAKVTLTFS